MPGVSDFFPPTQFSPIWAILGVLLIVAVVAWFAIVPALTRPKPQPFHLAPAFGPPGVPLRARYEHLIDGVEVAYLRGELSVRQSHQQLSAIVRGFAHESSGYPASAMTLTELRELNLPGLTEAVERFYPAEFGIASAGSVAESAAQARAVVREWA